MFLIINGLFGQNSHNSGAVKCKTWCPWCNYNMFQLSVGVPSLVPGRYVRVVSTMRLLRIRIRGPRCNRFFSSTSATHKDKTHKKAESARCKKRDIIRNVRASRPCYRVGKTGSFGGVSACAVDQSGMRGTAVLIDSWWVHVFPPNWRLGGSGRSIERIRG